MKEKFRKINDWYIRLNSKQRKIIWVVTAIVALNPWTGLLLGGTPWGILVLYMEYKRDSDK